MSNVRDPSAFCAWPKPGLLMVPLVLMVDTMLPTFAARGDCVCEYL
jgi:hypothetical protein